MALHKKPEKEGTFCAGGKNATWDCRMNRNFKNYAGGAKNRKGVSVISLPMSLDELMALSSLFWGPLLGHHRDILHHAEQVFSDVWDRAQPLLVSPKPTLEQALASLREISNPNK